MKTLQELNILNSFEENGGLFIARREHYDMAQAVLKSENPTQEQKDNASLICMSFICKSRSTRIDIDNLKGLN